MKKGNLALIFLLVLVTLFFACSKPEEMLVSKQCPSELSEPYWGSNMRGDAIYTYVSENGDTVRFKGREDLRLDSNKKCVDINSCPCITAVNIFLESNDSIIYSTFHGINFYQPMPSAFIRVEQEERGKTSYQICFPGLICVQMEQTYYGFYTFNSIFNLAFSSVNSTLKATFPAETNNTGFLFSKANGLETLYTRFVFTDESASTYSFIAWNLIKKESL